MALSLGTITQMAFMTRDIHASIDHFVSNLGIGPWFMIQGGTFTECYYRGVPSNVRLTTAFAYARGMEFELMQLDNDETSMWRDALQQPFELQCFHHWCHWPDDYDCTLNAALERGYRVYQEGSTTRGRFVYLDHPALGEILELTERTPERKAFQQQVAEAGMRWDGRQKIVTDWV